MNRYKTAAGEPLPHNSPKLFALLSETRRFKGWETGSMIVEHYKLYRREFGHLTECGTVTQNISASARSWVATVDGDSFHGFHHDFNELFIIIE